MFLLDTMVVSETGKRQPVMQVIDWLKRIDPDQLFVSVLSLGEISAGLLTPGLDPAFVARLRTWHAGLLMEYQRRSLPVTTEISLRWAELYVRLGRKDTDLLIAATALDHDLTVVTRNVRHFEPTGVRLLNPYAA